MGVLASFCDWCILKLCDCGIYLTQFFTCEDIKIEHIISFNVLAITVTNQLIFISIFLRSCERKTVFRCTLWCSQRGHILCPDIYCVGAYRSQDIYTSYQAYLAFWQISPLLRGQIYMKNVTSLPGPFSLYQLLKHKHLCYVSFKTVTFAAFPCC